MPRKLNRNQILIYISALRSLPDEYRDLIRSWEDVQKSPYSRSFYSSKDKTWDHTPDGCERISDHWNFRGKGNRGSQVRHCRTDRPITNGTHWTHAIYSAKDDLWHVVSSYSKQPK